MDGLALKADGRLGGVKALPLQLADGAAVDRVGVLAAKVEEADTLPLVEPKTLRCRWRPTSAAVPHFPCCKR